MEVSTLMPLELFDEICTESKAANTMPLQVIEHRPLERGCNKIFSLYRNDDMSTVAKELNGTGVSKGPNNEHVMASDDWTTPFGNEIRTNPGG
jgi:hypothetical protein